MKTKTILLKLLPVPAFAGLFVLSPNPVQADAPGMFGLVRNGPARSDVVQYRQRIGPFATWRRANEVAMEYQQRGYYTSQAFHSGDGYYFDVSTGDGNG
jgi:hypothetical protein